MSNKNSNQDLLGGAIAAALGAGVVTAFAVSQGQNPVIGLEITGLAVLVALLCERLNLV